MPKNQLPFLDCIVAVEKYTQMVHYSSCEKVNSQLIIITGGSLSNNNVQFVLWVESLLLKMEVKVDFRMKTTATASNDHVQSKITYYGPLITIITVWWWWC